MLNVIGNFIGANRSLERYSLANFVKVLTDEGIWDKLDYVNIPFLGATYAYKNLKTDEVVASLQNGEGYHDKTGFYGGSGTMHVATGFDFNAEGNKYLLNSAYLGIWNWSNLRENGVMFGAQQTGVGIVLVSPSRTDGKFRVQFNSTTYKETAWAGDVNEYISLAKTNNTVYVRRNNALIGAQTFATTAIPSVEPVILANSTGAVIGSVSLMKSGAIIIGGYLTEAEDLILSNEMHKLMAVYSDGNNYVDTEHVQYKADHMQSALSIVRKSGNYVFGKNATTIYMSIDGGVTFPFSKAFTNAAKINFAYIWDDGTVNFAERNKIYRSADFLTNVAEVVPTLNGAPYLPHTPVSAIYPGSYYKTIEVQDKTYVNGSEIFIWGNYANQGEGAAPTNIYEATNNGADIKVIYQFGQNQYYKDDGTDDGGSTGNLLGDAANGIKTRHVHSLFFDTATMKIYLCTGDTARAEFRECMWMRGDYDSEAGTWSFEKIVDGTEASSYKSVGFRLIGDYLYYGIDVYNAQIMGIWRTTLVNMANFALHEKIMNTTKEAISLHIKGNKWLVTQYAYPLIVWTSNDAGITWDQTLLDKLGQYPSNSLFPVSEIDENGRVFINEGNADRNIEVIIK